MLVSDMIISPKECPSSAVTFVCMIRSDVPSSVCIPPRSSVKMGTFRNQKSGMLWLLYMEHSTHGHTRNDVYTRVHSLSHTHMICTIWSYSWRRHMSIPIGPFFTLTYFLSFWASVHFSIVRYGNRKGNHDFISNSTYRHHNEHHNMDRSRPFGTLLWQSVPITLTHIYLQFNVTYRSKSKLNLLICLHGTLCRCMLSKVVCMLIGQIWYTWDAFHQRLRYSRTFKVTADVDILH